MKESSLTSAGKALTSLLLHTGRLSQGSNCQRKAGSRRLWSAPRLSNALLFPNNEREISQQCSLAMAERTCAYGDSFPLPSNQSRHHTGCLGLLGLSGDTLLLFDFRTQPWAVSPLTAPLFHKTLPSFKSSSSTKSSHS